MPNGGLIFHFTSDPSDTVRLGDRTVPRVLLAEISYPPLARKLPTVRMRLEVVGDRPQCREICYSSSPEGREIRQGDIDALRIADWVSDLFALAARRDGGDFFDALASAPEVRALVDAARKGNGPRKVDAAFLEQVAGVYARNLHQRPGGPTQAVAEAFGIAHSTAAEYVRRARATGLLPATSRGKRRA
jgi:hypothetical protein